MARSVPARIILLAGLAAAPMRRGRRRAAALS